MFYPRKAQASIPESSYDSEVYDARALFAEVKASVLRSARLPNGRLRAGYLDTRNPELKREAVRMSLVVTAREGNGHPLCPCWGEIPHSGSESQVGRGAQRTSGAPMEPERVSLGLSLQSSGELLARCGWCRNKESRRKARHGRRRNALA